jgi:L-2-hydroxyglutarate oxidase LhgO
MDRVDMVIIGAGVVGLSVAAHAARQNRSALLVERHGSFGRETSSRSSEVIHAGIYYPPGSLKARLCAEGNRLMYEICGRHGIPHKNTGKLVVAVTDEEASRLPGLLAAALASGAKGVQIIDGEAAGRLDPRVSCVAALHCPTSGIVDSHALMQHFRAVALERGVAEAYGVEVRTLDRRHDGYLVGVKEPTGEGFEVEARVVVNCAGLGSGEVSAMAGMDIDEAHYRIFFRKGVYFRVTRGLDRMPSMLVYPLPPADATVGIHTCPDLAGGTRLGPRDEWSDRVEYSVDESLGDHFYEACKPFLPSLRRDHLQPDTAGIQAKRFGPGEPSRDFVITDEADHGLPGFINLVGIESPGLTASPAIGKMVAGLVEAAL